MAHGCTTQRTATAEPVREVAGRRARRAFHPLGSGGSHWTRGDTPLPRSQEAESYRFGSWRERRASASPSLEYRRAPTGVAALAGIAITSPYSSYPTEDLRKLLALALSSFRRA